jgi:hypothetical protein
MDIIRPKEFKKARNIRNLWLGLVWGMDSPPGRPASRYTIFFFIENFRAVL